MGTLVTSKRETKYRLSADMSVVQSVVADEVHSMVVAMRQDAGGSVRATQQVTLTGVSVRLNSFSVMDNFGWKEKNYISYLYLLLFLEFLLWNCCPYFCNSLHTCFLATSEVKMCSRNSVGDQVSTSHFRVCSSIPVQSTWDVWCKEYQWVRFSLLIIVINVSHSLITALNICNVPSQLV